MPAGASIYDVFHPAVIRAATVGDASALSCRFFVASWLVIRSSAAAAGHGLSLFAA